MDFNLKIIELIDSVLNGEREDIENVLDEIKNLVCMWDTYTKDVETQKDAYYRAGLSLENQLRRINREIDDYDD
jgi:hypothetical protein